MAGPALRDAALLRAEGEALAARLPALLAEAQALAASVIAGEHGRRRPGHGADFWQYRTAVPGDDARRIDWRRSARSDAAFVQDKEWQAAQSVAIWADPGRSMDWTGDAARPTKLARGRLLAMASAALLVRGGERVGTPARPARRGTAALAPLAMDLLAPSDADYAAPDLTRLPAHGHAVMISDFLADPAPVESAIAAAASRGVRGALLQVLDPAEEEFPFAGRTIFESVGGTLRHETRRANDLAPRYRERLAERRDRLATLARRTGWFFGQHRTDAAPAPALLWLRQALERAA